VHSHHMIAVAVVLVIGFAVKMLFFPNHPAEAESRVFTSGTMKVLQMHVDYPHAKDLPEQRVEHLF
jgi:hypothetical protein